MHSAYRRQPPAYTSGLSNPHVPMQTKAWPKPIAIRDKGLQTVTLFRRRGDCLGMRRLRMKVA